MSNVELGGGRRVDPIEIYSVFINPVMFQSFFVMNPNLWPYRCAGLDNRGLNYGLPFLYNLIIEDAINRDAWLFFVHEDFEIKGDLWHETSKLNPNAVYGTFGVKLEDKTPVGYGMHICSNKDGSDAVRVGRAISRPQRVETLDCQSVLLHTSLLRRAPLLRFDEELTFDLYVEDLCMNAQFIHELPVFAFGLDFQHYSHGFITRRYREGLLYLGRKYPNIGVPGSCSFIGGRASELEEHFEYRIRANGTA